MAYWLLKTEAETFGWEHQLKRGAKGEPEREGGSSGGMLMSGHAGRCMKSWLVGVFDQSRQEPPFCQKAESTRLSDVGFVRESMLAMRRRKPPR